MVPEFFFINVSSDTRQRPQYLRVRVLASNEIISVPQFHMLKPWPPYVRMWLYLDIEPFKEVINY